MLDTTILMARARRNHVSGPSLPAPTVAFAKVVSNAPGSVTFTAAVGNMIILMMGVYEGNGTEAAAGAYSDSQGNTYALYDKYYSGVAAGNTTMTMFVYVCASAKAGSTTVSWTSSWGSYPTGSVIVVAGQNAANAIAVAASTPYPAAPSPITFSSGNLTTTTPNNLIIGLLAVAANNGWIPTAGSGFALQGAASSNDTTSAGVENMTQASPGTVAATFGATNTTGSNLPYEGGVCVALAIQP